MPVYYLMLNERQQRALERYIEVKRQSKYQSAIRILSDTLQRMRE